MLLCMRDLLAIAKFLVSLTRNFSDFCKIHIFVNYISGVSREDTVGAHRALRQQIGSRCCLRPVFDLCVANDDADDDDGDVDDWRRFDDGGGTQPHQETDERIHGVGTRGT